MSRISPGILLAKDELPISMHGRKAAPSRSSTEFISAIISLPIVTAARLSECIEELEDWLISEVEKQSFLPDEYAGSAL